MSGPRTAARRSRNTASPSAVPVRVHDEVPPVGEDTRQRAVLVRARRTNRAARPGRYRPGCAISCASEPIAGACRRSPRCRSIPRARTAILVRFQPILEAARYGRTASRARPTSVQNGWVLASVRLPPRRGAGCGARTATTRGAPTPARARSGCCPCGGAGSLSTEARRLAAGVVADAPAVGQLAARVEAAQVERRGKLALERHREEVRHRPSIHRFTGSTMSAAVSRAAVSLVLRGEE